MKKTVVINECVCIIYACICACIPACVCVCVCVRVHLNVYMSVDKAIIFFNIFFTLHLAFTTFFKAPAVCVTLASVKVAIYPMTHVGPVPGLAHAGPHSLASRPDMNQKSDIHWTTQLHLHSLSSGPDMNQKSDIHWTTELHLHNLSSTSNMNQKSDIIIAPNVSSVCNDAYKSSAFRVFELLEWHGVMGNGMWTKRASCPGWPRLTCKMQYPTWGQQRQFS